MILEIVVITVNRVEFLSALVNSIIVALSELSDQERKSILLRISDNGSSDGTADYLAKLATISPDFKICSRQHTVSAAEHIAVCLAEATSEYIWILGDDDLLEHRCLKNVLREIQFGREFDAFMLNFKQVDSDGVTVIKPKISDVPDDWSGHLSPRSVIGNGEHTGVFDMLFFVGALVYRTAALKVQTGDFDGSTDWDHLPVYLRSFVGANLKVISEANLIQRQRNHRKNQAESAINSYRHKSISGVRRLIEKIDEVVSVNSEAVLIFDMLSPYILEEHIYYRFLNFLILVCHAGTLKNLDQGGIDHIEADIAVILKVTPRTEDKLLLISYFNNLKELQLLRDLEKVRQKNIFTQLRVSARTPGSLR
jgi:glycosyltransferase involved in cell wall biosynthesis